MLTGLKHKPHRIVTEGLGSYSVSQRAILPEVRQAVEQMLRRGRVPPVLYQGVEHNPVLIHCPPEVVHHAAEAQEHLIELRSVGRPRPALAQPGRAVGLELGARAWTLS